MIDFSKRNLQTVWKKIYSNKPSKKRMRSRGIDGVTMEYFEDEKNQRIQDINRQLEDGSFVFDKLLHYQEDQKGKKKKRDIQAPTVKDRIVQKIISDHLVNGELKGVFSGADVVGAKGSNIRSVIGNILKYQHDGFVYVFKTDLINYFPSIDKKRLRRIVGQYIVDTEAKKFIWQYLDNSDLPGIPQGPPLSPLMANLYLLSFDRYLTARKKIHHIRYVDDILVFCRSRRDANRSYNLVKNHLESFHLSIHPLGEENGKTVIDRFDSGNIDALGIIYKNGKILIKPKKLERFRNDFINPIRWTKLRKLPGLKKEKKVSGFISTFNLKLKGWGQAYSFCDTKELYLQLDRKIAENFEIFLKRNRVNNWEVYMQDIAKLSKIKASSLNLGRGE